MTGPDYLASARRRRQPRGHAPAARPVGPAKRPYAAAPADRYAALAAPPAAIKPELAAPEPLAAPPAAHAERRASRPVKAARVAVAAPGPTGPNADTSGLAGGMARVRAGQAVASAPPTKPPARPPETRRLALHRPRHPVRFTILSVLAVAVLVAAATLGPVLYRGGRAYRDIFQDPAPHVDQPFVAQVNPEGTSVIVPATATTGASIPDWDGKERVTVLLLGVDRREDEASRSDTMILVNIDPVAKTANMLAIPRDLKVIIPGYGVHKINSAYAYGDADKVPGGGAGLTMRTIETNFGITVNYYAQVDFEGFTKIIDTVGGLTLDVPYPIKDDEYPGPGNQYMRIFFQTGWQHMNGAQVLQYARTRHQDGDGRRSARQEQVLLAIREQAVNRGLLSKATQLLADFGNAVRTDLQPSQALQLARLGSEIEPDAITRVSLDDALTEQQLPDQPYFLIADWNVVGTIMTQFMGKPVLPPLAALGDSNLGIEIQIEDGTYNPGLGDRVKQVLIANGFTNVTVTDLPDLGNYPTSSITTDKANLTAAYLVASVLGLDVDAILIPDDAALTATAPAATATPTPVASATPTPAGSPAASPVVNAVPLFPTAPGGAAAAPTGPPAKLVLVIGDDAPDPAYTSADPYSDDTGAGDQGGQ